MNREEIFALLVIFILVFGVSAATIIDFKEQYQDYNGNLHTYNGENLASYPMYNVTDNGNNIIITRFNETITLPKRVWLYYDFYPDRIVPVIKIDSASQISSISTKINPSLWYVSSPWAASKVKHVTDDFIDMGVFSRSLQYEIWDSNTSENKKYYQNFKIKPKVIGNEIRIYFNPQNFSQVVYPLYISERTIVVNNATTAGWTTTNVSLNGSRWTDDGALAIHLRNDSQLNMSGLVAYWSFDETTGTLIRNVNTESGLINTTNQGTWYGNTTLNYSSGKIGSAGKFDGVNDYVVVPDNDSLDIVGKITLETWIKPSSTGLITIIDKGLDDTVNNYVVSINSGKIEFAYLSSLNVWHVWNSTNVIVTTGNWQHVIITFIYGTGTSIKVYHNGLLQTGSWISGTGNLIPPANTYALRIGSANYYGNIQFFNGSIDEVRIYNRALSAEEIAIAYDTSMRTLAMPVIMNQTASVGNVINRTRIVYTGQDSINNASIYARQNGTTTWTLIQSNATSNTWYPITNQFNSMDFGIMLEGNGSNTLFFTSLEWDEIDITPPASITGLTNTTGNFYHNWTWTNPTDSDFNHTMIYFNGTFVQNQSTNFYNLTANAHNETTISTQTVDVVGNVNLTWVNQTSVIPNNIPSLSVDNQTADEGQTVYVQLNFTDPDFDTLIYSINRTDLFTDFSSSTGKGNWTTNYTSAGIYSIDAGVDDGYGGIANYTFVITVNNTSPIPVTSCGTLSIDGEYYSLQNNVSSAGTCFVVGAHNITLDGQGYWINYSQTVYGNGIRNVDGYDNITIKNVNIIQMNSTVQYGAAINYDDSNFSIFENNTIFTSNTYTTAFALWTCNYTTIINNSIYATGIGTSAVWLYKSKFNNFYDNYILSKNYLGFQLEYSDNNNVYNGSIISETHADYYLYETGITNNFTNTNFTTRRIRFFDINSRFNYNNEFNENIWLKTNVSIAGSTIIRTLITWSQSQMKWNDSAAVTAYYDIFGLLPDREYRIYNNSVNSYNLTTDALGTLPQFSIVLNGETQIQVLEYIAPTEFIPPIPINCNAQTGNFWINTSCSSGSGNITDGMNKTNGTFWLNNTLFWMNNTLSPHAWDNISFYAYNNSGNGSLNLTPGTLNTQIPNNVPVMDMIGDKNVNEGAWLNFSITGSDLDNDSLTCSGNNTKGTLSNCNFNWSVTYADAGVYNWIFYLNDSYGGMDDEIITVTINEMNFSSNITAWHNSINGWNQTVMSINAGNSATFNVTVNQTITNVSWKVAGSEEQNTSSLEFTRAFNTLGDFNVTAQAFNANGSSNIVYTIVTVTESSGGGTDWDYAYGWVKHENGTAVVGATVTTSQGSDTTDVNGYYDFGYVFEHGLTYWFNITKLGYYENDTQVVFVTGDYQVHNVTLLVIPPPEVPAIISYGNNYTNDSNLSFTVPKYTNILFNATANQTITTWTWTGATKINGDGTTDSTASKNFSTVGVQSVSVYGTNANGSTQTITWMITVSGVGNLTLSGYVQNELEAPLEKARVDFNDGYTFTDVNGYYSFTNVTEGFYNGLARAIGYRNSTVPITLMNDTTLNFTLQERKDAVASVTTPGFEVILILFILPVVYLIMRR